MPRIVEGQIWRDLDPLNYYNVTKDGEYPVPKDYEGLIGIRRRLVKVISKDFPGQNVIVENVHNGRRSKIRLAAFKDSETNSQGRPRRRDFVLEQDVDS